MLAPNAAVPSEFESIIERCYGANPPVYLRTLDAIHLASARKSGQAETVATDRRLRAAAEMFGLTIFPTMPSSVRAPSV